jgi:gliding motility-associated-like protein
VNPITVDGRRTEPEVLWVEVADNHGCVGSDTLILEVCDAALLFKNIPNTITPGDEGKNNEWVIPNIDLFPDAIIEIYDRWGRLVYRTDDVAHNPWKGETMSGKELPMDAYFYVLDIKVAHVPPVTGYVNVIR